MYTILADGQKFKLMAQAVSHARGFEDSDHIVIRISGIDCGDGCVIPEMDVTVGEWVGMGELLVEAGVLTSF